MDDLTLPLSALRLGDDGTGTADAAVLHHGGDEALAVGLMRAIRRVAEVAAGQPVEVVSVSLDRAGAIDAAGDALQFRAAIDRKTRTIVFAHGDVRQGGAGTAVILAATAVYRIPSSDQARSA